MVPGIYEDEHFDNGGHGLQVGQQIFNLALLEVRL